MSLTSTMSLLSTAYSRIRPPRPPRGSWAKWLNYLSKSTRGEQKEKRILLFFCTICLFLMLVRRLRNVSARFESEGGVLPEEVLDSKEPEGAEISMVGSSWPNLKGPFELGKTILISFRTSSTEAMGSKLSQGRRKTLAPSPSTKSKNQGGG